MANDSTFGVKVSEETKERARKLIESSNLSSKEWFEKFLAISETHSLKDGSVDYQQDLAELDLHTTRIFELVSNMVQRSVFIKETAVKELETKIEEKDRMISDYNAKAIEAAAAAEEFNQLYQEALSRQTEIEHHLSQSLNTNDTNKDLIKEYKEKIDTLSGLVNRYQVFEEENKTIKDKAEGEKQQILQEAQKEKDQLQNELADEKEKSVQMNGQQRDLEAKIQQLTEKMERNTRDFEIELERLAEQKEVEKERALLKQQKEQQDKTMELQDKYSAKIEQLYKDIENIRKNYEKKNQDEIADNE